MGYTGHINVASGFGPWPVALALRDDLALRAGVLAMRAGRTAERRAIA